MTRGSGGQPDYNQTGGLCGWQRCSRDADRGLGDWALWFRTRGCKAERWLLVAGSWDCDWRRSNHPWGSLYVLVDVSRQNAVARLPIDKSVQPNETSSGTSDSWSRYQPPWKYLISYDTSFRQKHQRVPGGSDGSDGTSYPLTGNYMLPVAQAMWGVAHVPPVPCCDVYAQSERYVCYTLRSGCSYAEAIYTTPGNHSYYLSFNDFQNLCIQFVFSTMYLCIYIATYQHTV